MKLIKVDFIVRVAAMLLKCIPMSFRRSLVFCMAQSIFKHAGNRRLRSIKNLMCAVPELTMGEAENIALASYQNYIFGIMEFYWINELEIEIECDAATLELLKNDRGVSVATMHMGCSGVVPFTLQKLTGTEKIFSSVPELSKSVRQLFAHCNVSIICEKQSGYFLELLEASRSGAVICLPADHYVDDVQVKFFNQCTEAPGSIAVLSAYSAVPLLLCYPVLSDDGQYKVVIETVFSKAVGRSKNEIVSAMQKIYIRFEQVIMQYPEQWSWSYNRWQD